MSKRYEIIKLIENDRLGDVFLAQDLTLERKVIYRTFRCDEGEALSDELEQYTGTLCMLQHPNLLTVFDIGREEGKSFMVTQFVDGERLDNRLLSGPLSETGVYNMASDLLEAFHAMHDAGVIHGALSRDSVLRLPRVRGGHRYLIMDLGLDKITSMVCGEPERGAEVVLVAPELFEGGAPNERSDLFALGQLCYMALVGGHPMAESSAEECLQAYREGGMPDLLGYVPEMQRDFAEWVMKMVSADPEQRPESASEAMSLLNAIKLEVPAPNVPGVTQAVAEVAPAEPPRVSQALTVSSEESGGGWFTSLPKNVKIIAGLVAAIVVVLAFVAFSGGKSKEKAGGHKALSNEPVFLDSPKMVRAFRGASSPKLIKLDLEDSLDWSVIDGVPSSSEKVDKTRGSYISGIFPSGKFKEFPMSRSLVVFEGNGLKITNRGAITDVKKGHAKIGDGWDITLHIPKGHQGAIEVALYMLQDGCDFDVIVQLPKKGAKKIRLRAAYDAVGGAPGVVQIPLVISKPVAGGFYGIKIVSASKGSSSQFGMGLRAVHVKRY